MDQKKNCDQNFGFFFFWYKYVSVKKQWIKIDFGPLKNNLGIKKFFGPRIFIFENLSPIEFGVKKKLGENKICINKKFGQKIFGQKIFWVPKILGPK